MWFFDVHLPYALPLLGKRLHCCMSLHKVEKNKSDITYERNNVDMQFCGSVMENVLKVEYERDDIVKVVILRSMTTRKKRPLLIEFSIAQVKNM